MQLRLGVFVWTLLASCVSAFIIPEELVSFLSIVYSNIPPIKKGTDSRVGLGFRLGPHADAQLVLELGPQTNTRPLGPNAQGPDTRKRHALVATSTPPDTDTDAGQGQGSNWLSSWRTSVALKQGASSEFLGDDNHNEPIAPEEDPTKFSKESLVHHLRQLYRKIPKEPTRVLNATDVPSSTPSLSLPNNRGQVYKLFKAKPGSKPIISKVPTFEPTASREDLSDVSIDK